MKKHRQPWALFLLVALLATGCGLTFASAAENPGATVAAPPAAQPTATLTASATPTDGAAVSATVTPTVGADVPGTRYANYDYGFAFHYPATWTLHDDTEGQVRLTQGPLQLVVAFWRSGDDGTAPPWTGLPAGDLRTMEPLPFMGGEIAKQVLVYEDKTKAVLYTGQPAGVVFAIRLDDTVTADYAAVAISDAAQREVDAIVSAFTPLPDLGTKEGLTVVGQVAGASPSARIITLTEAVDGIDVIALTDDAELVSADGSPLALNQIQPGMTVEAAGRPGEGGALLADRVRVAAP